MKKIITLFVTAACFAVNAQNVWDGSTTSTLSTNGKAGIGVANVNSNYRLFVGNTVNPLASGIRIDQFNESSNQQYGLHITNQLSGTSGKKYGIFNSMGTSSSGNSYGIYNITSGWTTGNRMGIASIVTSGEGKIECGIYSAVNTTAILDPIFPTADRAAYFIGVVETVAPSATASAFIVRGTSSDVFRIYGDGKVYATEVNVLLASQFPDYVFKPEYNLMPLPALSNYIQSNGHLPNMPTAQEIETNGMNVGELSKTVVEKIEELTLYLLEQQKQIDAQKLQIEALTIQLEKSQN